VSNLLPEKDKKKIKREYLTRLLIVILLFSALTISLNLLLLLPSYFLSNGDRGLIEERVSFLKSYLEIRKESGITSVLPLTNEKIKALEISEIPKINSSIKSILSEKSRSIRINSFNLRSSNDGSRTLLISGRADNRDGLISFSESLKSTGSFVDIDLPLSNLAKNINVDFSIKIGLK
jgi:hypothetical protein